MSEDICEAFRASGFYHLLALEKLSGWAAQRASGAARLALGTQYPRPVTRGNGLAATLGVLVVAGGLAVGCGGGADVMRATLTADGCTYEGDTTPAPGVFRVEVRNETHDVANFAVAELAEGARIEEIEPWYENERRKLEQPGPYDFNPTQFAVVGSSSAVGPGASSELPVNESSGRYVVLCALGAGSVTGGWGFRLFAATELNVQPTS